MWEVPSDEKSGLYFSVFVGHRQGSLFQIWVPRDYFIVSIFETLPTWRARFLYFTQEQGTPTMPQGIGFV
jgi:hypothetical protein